MRINRIIHKFDQFIRDPRKFYSWLALRRLYKRQCSLNDEEYLKRAFRIIFGYNLDLQHPVSFNEKMQFLKLNARKDIYTTMVDKHLAKQFVSDALGESVVARELGVYDRAEEIDVDSLPAQFVLKTTHGCGGMMIVKDKNEFDINEAIKKLNPSLADNYYLHCREWPYKNVKPRIIAEEYLQDPNHSVLPVYKFFCFNGVPFLLQAIKNDKQDNETIDYFDMEWNNLHIRQNFANSKEPLPKPSSFETMKHYCEKLSKGIPFVRCDFYDVSGTALFSEFTFFSDAGFEKFYPKKWDILLGEKIDLSLV